jgi:hypothetical protein
MGSNSGRGGGKLRPGAAKLRKTKKRISQKQKNDYLGASEHEAGMLITHAP